MIIERPNFSMPWVALLWQSSGCAGGGIALLIKLNRHQEKTIGENRYHANTCNASLRLGPTRGELHGSYGRASLQRRDRSDLAADYHFVRPKPGAGRRARFRSNLNGGRRELSLRIFRRPWKPA